MYYMTIAKQLNTILSKNVSLNCILSKTLNRGLAYTLFSQKQKAQIQLPVLKKRFYSTKTDKILTPEEELNIINDRLKEITNRNVLIFSNNNKIDAIMMNVLGVVGSLLVFYMSYFGYELFGTVRNIKRDPNVERNLLEKVVDTIGTDSFRNFICGFCALFGFGVLYLGFTFPKRQIKQLYLLKGGSKVGIVVPGNFLIEKSFTTKLENISFSKRIGSTQLDAISFKIKDKPNYQMDLRKGVLHEKLLFNYLICSKRF